MRLRRPGALLVAFWAVLYLPPLLAGRTLPARDIGATQIPWRTVWAGQVRAGELPLWDPLSNQGRPLWANPNAMAAYPGTLLFLLAGPERAMAWHLAFHHLVLLLGCFVLARRSGAGPPAALVAASAVGTSGVAFSLLTFANAQASFAWTPWALATALDPPREPRARLGRAAAAGAIVGLSFLAGEPITALLAALTWTTVALASWRPLPWAGLGAAALAAALVAAPVLVPLATLYPETVRGALGSAPAALGADALAPRRWIELLLPNLLGPPLADGGSGFWARASFPWQRYYPLVFVPALALVCLPFARSRGRRLGVWWAVLAVGAVGATLAGLPALAGPLHRLPLLSAARYGVKLLLPATLALVPLAAAGWEELAAAWERRGRRIMALAAALAGAVLLAAGLPGLGVRPALAALYPAASPALAAVPDRRLAVWGGGDAASQLAPIVAALASAGSAPVAAAALLAADTLAARGVLAFDGVSAWAAPTRLAGSLPPASLLAAQAPRGAPDEPAGNASLARFWASRGALVPNYASRWGLGYTLARGPDGLEPVRGGLLAAAAEQLPLDRRARVARALGAAALVAPADAGEGRLVDGVRVVDLSPTAPPVYLARRQVPADGPVAAVDALASEGFRPGLDAVVDGQGAVCELGGGTVREEPGRPDHRRFEVASPGPGLLVVQQSYLSAWRATVDGVPAAVVPANGACLGVRVPAGTHAVDLFIDRRPYLVGLCGPPLLLALVVLVRRRGRGAR